MRTTFEKELSESSEYQPNSKTKKSRKRRIAKKRKGKIVKKEESLGVKLF
jgi:hypothetical protein